MGALIYWPPFILLALLSFWRLRAGAAAAVATAGFLIVWIGLRHEVGDDWGTYLSWVESAKGTDLISALQSTDPGYALLNWIGANWFGGIYLVNLACATLAVVPLVVFCSRQVNPPLALLVAIPYLVTVVYMGYTRQSVALGFGMLAMLAVQQRKLSRYLLYVTLAAVFHKTAVCLLVFAPALFAGSWNRAAFVRLAGLIIYGIILALVVLWGQAASLIEGYIITAGEAPASHSVEAMPTQPAPDSAGFIASAGGIKQVTSEEGVRLYSAGAHVRLGQSVVAAASFALIAWRLRLTAPALWLWTISSVVVICLFALAFWRSTLADRSGLFFVPLQLYAFSTLPSIFEPPTRHFVQGAIIVCSAAAFGVWLTYGDNAPSWLPYQSALQHWL